MIFTFYDPIEYTAKTVSKNAQTMLLTNIFKNYGGYFKHVAAKYNLITYYIQGAPRPEHLSYQLYQNTQYYWVLLMANAVYDPFRDWIKSQQEVYDSVDQQYTNPESVIMYHKDLKGERYYNLIQYDDEPGVWYDKGDKNRLYPQYKGELGAVNAYEDALVENERKREIKIISPADIDKFISDFIAELERNDAATIR